MEKGKRFVELTNDEKLRFPEDPTDKEYLNNDSNSEESDEKFITYLQTIESIDIPESIMENIKKNIKKKYQEDYKYIILWRKIKIKIQKLKDFLLPNIPTNVGVVLASLLIVCTVGFYYFMSDKDKTSSSTLEEPEDDTTVEKPDDTMREIPTEITGKELKEVNNIVIKFSIDEKRNFIKEKIIEELKKGPFNITDDKERADAILSVSNNNEKLVIKLKNGGRKLLWFKSFPVNETNLPLLEDLFSKVEKQKTK